MASLEEIVKQLSTPAPAYEDPEDDAGDGTNAQLASNLTDDNEDSFTSPRQSTQLRRRAAAYLEVDSRYHGAKTSRKDLYEFGDDNEENDDEGVGRSESEESVSNPLDFGVDKEDDMSADNDIEDEEMADEQDDDGDDSDDVEEEETGSEEEKDENNEEIMSSESESEGVTIQGTGKDDGEKAQAVVEQLDLWDRLMEARIKLQKTLSLVHKIPTGVQDGEAQQGAQSALNELGCSLCGLQSPNKSTPRKRKADADLEQRAKENFTSYQPYRNDTLTFWDDKTRLASKKFKSFNSFNTSVLKQIEQILSDRDRLVRRTRVSRDADAGDIKPEEIFDDNDFYQKLLRQLVEHKAADAENSASTQSQWLEIQKLRTKKKKKEVDTRASKGRKLRYNVHSKLVNFMAPRDDSTWSEDAKNELFKNLFKMPTDAEG
ncbi:protein AATF-like [Littorina saxatilis]|uniref:Protein AATF n=1 Tax=Littorina saxatilis TaxID=31220 RepID=A0AAN9B593_9CAEN